MSEQQPEQKAPVVEIKSAPKRKPKEDPKPSAAATKLLEQLKEVSKEIARLESLREDRTALIAKATEQKVPTAQIASAAGLSVARLRQVQPKTKK
jgi:hypothetical protein